MAGRKPQQRITELRVAEVSLVGDPANEEEFLVIKSRGGSDMAERTKDTAAPTAVASNDGAPAAEGQGTVTTKAQEGAVQGNAPAKAPVSGVDEGGGSATQQSGAGPDNAKTVATATAGAPSDDANTQLEKLQKRVENLAAMLGPPALSLDGKGGGKEGEPKEGDEGKPKEGDEKEGEGDAKEASMASVQATLNEIRNGLQALVEASGITKGKPEGGEPEGKKPEATVEKGAKEAEKIKWRAERVREAAGIMLEILHDMDYDMAQALMKSVGDGKVPVKPEAAPAKPEAAPTASTTKEKPPVTESTPTIPDDTLAAAVEKQVGPIREQVTGLLETIKNVRGVGNAEGTDITEEPQQTVKSVWGGRIAPPGMLKG